MKNVTFWKLTLGLALSALPFAGGCLQETSMQPAGPSAAVVTTASDPPTYEAPPPEAPAPEANASDAPDLSTLADAPVQPVSSNQPAPPKVNLSAPAAELVKMANSGVEQSVMLAYVTNSTSTFNLKAEDIIYLNDLGVPSTVVTAMIQHDQGIRANAAASLAAPPVAAPAPQPAPVYSQVAPQPVNPAPDYYPTEPPPAPPAEPEVVTYPEFYDSLTPYGTWVYVGGYGYCWRPTVVVVNPGWQPYFDSGHWVYTDCGWYWSSDYSWGWAPFHYGRWFHHNGFGWCWAPGTVWGPSWVAWRYNSGYCGWAPLPPGAYFSFSIGLTFHGRHIRDWDDCGLRPAHYRFVAWRDFDSHQLHEHGLAPRQVNQIYNNTVVINHITVVNNNTVINQGLPRERVVAATHHDVKPLVIQHVSAASAPLAGRAEHQSGNTLTVYRPQLSKPLSTTTTVGGSFAKPIARGGAPSVSKPMPVPGQPPVNFNSAAPAKPAQVAPSAPAAGGNVRQPIQKPTAPGRQALQTTPNNTQGGSSSSFSKPTVATTQPPSVAKPAPAPPAWRNADPNSRFERIQSQTRSSANSPQYSAPASKQPAPAYTAQEVPRYAPAPAYTPQRAVEAPRSAPTPAYNAPQRSYSPAPAYTAPQRSYSPAPNYSSSRSEPAPSRATPSYSEGSRYSAPALSSPKASGSESRSAPPSYSNSRNDNNGGGRNNR